MLIKNARVLDPSIGYDESDEDLAIANGKLLKNCRDVAPRLVIDAKDCIVIPGLIDFHKHIFPTGSQYGVHADISSLCDGVIGAVDAGSAGTANYESLEQYLCTQQLFTKAFLNFAPMGIATREHPEMICPDKWSSAGFAAMRDRFPRIIGMKLRASRDVVGNDGKTVRKAIDLAHKAGMPINLHICNSAIPVEEFLPIMEANDIICHPYHNRGENILDDEGHVKPCVWDARKRGVLFDSAEGYSNISYIEMEKALRDGFYPDIISTDMTNFTWNLTRLTQTHIINKYMQLGMSLMEVIRACTTTPAAYMGENGLCRLFGGGNASFTMLCAEDSVLVDDNFGFSGSSFISRPYWMAVASVLNGDIVYLAERFLRS